MQLIRVVPQEDHSASGLRPPAESPTELRCLVGRLYIRSLDVTKAFKHLPQGLELAQFNTFDAKVFTCFADGAARRAKRRGRRHECPAQFTGRPSPWASHPFSQPIAEFDDKIGHQSNSKPSLPYGRCRSPGTSQLESAATVDKTHRMSDLDPYSSLGVLSLPNTTSGSLVWCRPPRTGSAASWPRL